MANQIVKIGPLEMELIIPTMKETLIGLVCSLIVMLIMFGQISHISIASEYNLSSMDILCASQAVNGVHIGNNTWKCEMQELTPVCFEVKKNDTN